MEIKTAVYKGSFVEVEKCPDAWLPEHALIGRSNVGKSSLINYLCKQANMARTSANPGKTQTLNFYEIDSTWHLVDLPGYGYAKVSKEMRGNWDKMIRNYLLRRPQLCSVWVLVDARIPPQKIDVEFINWLGENNVPFIIVFTKADKLRGESLGHIEAMKERLKETWAELPEMFVTSSAKTVGAEALIAYAEGVNTVFRNQPKP
ncbi:MAG: ribosome biogenesis GTP-binding protein YihA/YsxC [Chitinophagales bacterium]